MISMPSEPLEEKSAILPYSSIASPPHNFLIKNSQFAVTVFYACLLAKGLEGKWPPVSKPKL